MGFHLADGLARLHRRNRKGAPDTFDAAGYAALLRGLHEDSNEVVDAPDFQRWLEQPIAGAIRVSPSARLIITEGNYLLFQQHSWGRVQTQLDEVWYVDLDADERLRRLIARHVRFGKDPAAAATWATSTDERDSSRDTQLARDGPCNPSAGLSRMARRVLPQKILRVPRTNRPSAPSARPLTMQRSSPLYPPRTAISSSAGVTDRGTPHDDG
ncbi:MAG TPA: hypothetical protein VIY28_04910 [Pseudonocardiaceae bacterium]